MKETKLETLIRMTKVLNSFKEQHPRIIDIGVVSTETFYETMGNDLPLSKEIKPYQGEYAGYIRIKCSDKLTKHLGCKSIWEYIVRDKAEDAIIDAVQVLHAICTARSYKDEAEFMGSISRAISSLDFNPTL